jgi:hypothetical protein
VHLTLQHSIEAFRKLFYSGGTILLAVYVLTELEVPENPSEPLEDPKGLAKTLLKEGVDPEEVSQRTGLTLPQVNGIKGSLMKSSKAKKTEAEPSDLGKADDEEKSLIADFKGENTLAASAVVLARNKSRLRQTDPTLFNSLFPSGQPESNASRTLVDLETAKLIRAMRQEEEHRNNNGDSQNTVELQKQINDLREELHKKDFEALKQQSDKLQEEIRELRTDLRSSAGSTSDLAVIVKESKDLLSQVITHDGVLRRYLLPDNISIKPPSDAPVLRAQPVEARNGVIDVLRERGLTTRVVQR